MTVTLLDALVFVVFCVGLLAGWRRGLVSEIIAIIGLVAVLVISWMVKGQISVYLYQYLPFFKFAGAIKGVTALNILVYELIAFGLVITVLGVVLGIILKVTGLLEKVLRSTVLLSIPSKIMGAIVGVVEAYIIVFVGLCVLSQPFIRFVNVQESKYSYKIVTSTPILSDKVSGVIKSGEDIYYLIKNSKNLSTSEKNYQTLEALLKYNVVKPDSVDYLVDKGKLKISGAKALADRYR